MVSWISRADHPDLRRSINHLWSLQRIPCYVSRGCRKEWRHWAAIVKQQIWWSNRRSDVRNCKAHSRRCVDFPERRVHLHCYLCRPIRCSNLLHRRVRAWYALYYSAIPARCSDLDPLRLYWHVNRCPRQRSYNQRGTQKSRRRFQCGFQRRSCPRLRPCRSSPSCACSLDDEL